MAHGVIILYRILYVDVLPYFFQLLNCAYVILLTEVFVPCPDGLLVNLHEAKEMVIDFLNKLHGWFEKNMQTGSALGPALQAAYKLLVSPSDRRSATAGMADRGHCIVRAENRQYRKSLKL